MHASHSVSAACRPAEAAGQRGEIGSVQRSIRLGQICSTVVRGLKAVELFFILCDVSGNRKSKMAAYTLKILTSQLAYNLATQFQRLNMFSRFKIRITRFSILCNASKHYKFRVAPYKPEVLTSRPAYIIAENSNGNTYVFEEEELIEAIFNKI